MDAAFRDSLERRTDYVAEFRVLRPDGDGFRLHYDPAIAVPLKAVTRESAQAGEAALWQLYDALTCETLLLRGALSDLLSADTALAMTRRGPKARLVVFDGVGHAPEARRRKREDERHVRRGAGGNGLPRGGRRRGRRRRPLRRPG